VKLVFHETAWEDYLYWQATDPKFLERLNLLIRECCRTPFAGTGNPSRCGESYPAGGRGA
jgi:toxin YoeB